jgi:hypothetical protein
MHSQWDRPKGLTVSSHHIAEKVVIDPGYLDVVVIRVGDAAEVSRFKTQGQACKLVVGRSRIVVEVVGRGEEVVGESQLGRRLSGFLTKLCAVEEWGKQRRRARGCFDFH